MMVTNEDVQNEISAEIEALEGEEDDNNALENEGEVSGTSETPEELTEVVPEGEGESFPEIEQEGIPEADTDIQSNETPELEDSKEPTTEQLLKALDFIEDTFDRAAALFVTLGETARGLYMYNDPFYYDSIIHIGVRKGVYMGFAKSTLDTFLPEPTEQEENSMIYEIEGCPVIMEIVEDLQWFKDYDSKGYMGRIYAIPNPFTVTPSPKGYYESNFGKYPQEEE